MVGVISGVKRQTEIYLNGLAGKQPTVPADPGRLKEAAREQMSPEAFAYVAGGAGKENTVHENRAAFARRRLVPRMLRDVSERDTSVELFGRRLPAPILLAPIGVLEMAHREADVAVAKATAAEGVPFIFSNQASKPMEECAAAMGNEPRWFQLYWSTSDALVEMSRNYPGSSFRNLVSGEPLAAVRKFIATYSRPSLTWENLAFLRERTKLPIMLKGILHPEDAKKAVEHGMDGVIVSNHGGRQVDGAIATLDALPDVVEAVDGNIPVLFDSGVRGGADVLKALALGARAVCLGRPYVYGLALGGEEGVRNVIRNLIADFDLTMGLAGCRSVSEIQGTNLARTDSARHHPRRFCG